jgi:hypothetical protein
MHTKSKTTCDHTETTLPSPPSPQTQTAFSGLILSLQTEVVFYLDNSYVSREAVFVKSGGVRAAASSD